MSGSPSAWPKVGLGTSALAGRRAAVTEADAQAVLEIASSGGLDLFDTAPLYGYGAAEAQIGRFVGRTGSRPRLISKVGRRLVPVSEGGVRHPGYVGAGAMGAAFDYGAAAARDGYAASLSRMGVSRLDGLMLHDLGRLAHGADADAREHEALTGAWPVLQALRAEGAVGAIGLAVNEWEVCDRWLDLTDPDLFVIAARMTLLDFAPILPFLDRCARRGVTVIAAAPFASGLLASEPGMAAFHNYRPASPKMLARAERLRGLCAAAGTTLTAAALAFPLTLPAVTTVVAGCRTPEQARGLVEASLQSPSIEVLQRLRGAV